LKKWNDEPEANFRPLPSNTGILMNAFKVFFRFTLLCAVLGFSGLQAQTEAAGEVKGCWGNDQSPVLVVDNIVVAESDTLRILPGVKVVFMKPARLTVNGRLLAFGGMEPGEAVVFTSVRDEQVLSAEYDKFKRPDRKAPVPGKEWEGIAFENQGADVSQLENVIIRFSRDGIRCLDSYPMLKNIFIESAASVRMDLNGKATAIEAGKWADYPLGEEGLRCIAHIDQKVLNPDDLLKVRLSVSNITPNRLFGIRMSEAPSKSAAEFEAVDSNPSIPMLEPSQSQNLERTFRVKAKRNASINLGFFAYTLAKGDAVFSNYAFSDMLMILGPKGETQAAIGQPASKPVKQEQTVKPVREIVAGHKPFYKSRWVLGGTAVAVVAGITYALLPKGGGGNGQDENLPEAPDYP
jgi:hypothetical protein